MVTRAHPETGVDLTYVKLAGESDGTAGDKYTGLDAFGRVVDQRWTTSGGTAADRRQYGYDRDGNRLYADNQVSTSNSELYAYDGLNQLTSFQRGTLNGTKDGLTGSASRSQSWDFDAVGNFDSQTTDGTTQTRSANKQNEITSISGATTPTYSAAGEMTGDEAGRQLVYDAWGRLVVVKNSGGTTLATYRYDGLNRRVRDVEAATTDLYYSDQWQVLEEDVSGSAVNSYAWSPIYVDALIARDSGGTRLYAAQDANWNVVGLITPGGAVAERYLYDSYGTQTVTDGAWNTRSGSSYSWVYGFQGLRYDAAARGLVAHERELSPSLGRWFLIDPAKFTGRDTNLYRFVYNSPTIYVDPSGLVGWSWWGAVGGAVVGGVAGGISGGPPGAVGGAIGGFIIGGVSAGTIAPNAPWWQKMILGGGSVAIVGLVIVGGPPVVRAIALVARRVPAPPPAKPKRPWGPVGPGARRWVQNPNGNGGQWKVRGNNGNWVPDPNPPPPPPNANQPPNAGN